MQADAPITEHLRFALALSDYVLSVIIDMLIPNIQSLIFLTVGNQEAFDYRPTSVFRPENTTFLMILKMGRSVDFPIGRIRCGSKRLVIEVERT